jgi:uncharacterized membrane protein YccF (DUF307 family)
MRNIVCGLHFIVNITFEITRGMDNFLGNIIWLIFGGLLAAIGYFVGGFVLCTTVVGIPWGLQCLKLGRLVLWPFGKKVISDGSDVGCLNLLCNIIWILSGGLYTAIVHLVMGFILCITIIGIPWGRQHFKLMEISLMPFGKRIVWA